MIHFGIELRNVLLFMVIRCHFLSCNKPQNLARVVRDVKKTRGILTLAGWRWGSRGLVQHTSAPYSLENSSRKIVVIHHFPSHSGVGKFP